MYIERLPNRNSPPAVLLRESWREDGKIVNKKKISKHFILAIEDDALTFERNEEKISAEATIDGLYVIRSSVHKTHITDPELVANYKKS